MAKPEISSDLERKLSGLPDRPGVYLLKDGEGEIVYVGKAVNLKNRVRTYFQDAVRLSLKVAAMMRHVRDLEIICTDTEVEALILEATLIKRHRPRYNIRLKDDKAYPYLRLSWEEDFPRLLIARRPAKDGGRYFGPFPRAQSVHETIRLLRKIFPIRNCTNQKFRNQTRPCLEFHIKRCEAPCVNAVDRESYRAMMRRVEWFLEGRVEEVVRDLKQQLAAAADALQFERAGELRDQIRAIEEVTAQQKVSRDAGRELDAIAWVVADSQAFVQVFQVRDGRLTAREAFTLDGVEGTEEEELARSFLLQYYESANSIPQEILVPADPGSDLDPWLKSRRGGRVAIRVPRRGEKEHLLAMVRKNAELARDEALRRSDNRERIRREGLLELMHALGLERVPRRMECYDISNTQGTESVASMVVFTDGRPDKSQYRRFKIQTVEGPNDFQSMYEVIGRRFRHAGKEAAGPGMKRFASPPDLVLIDGGPGQVGYAARAMREQEVRDIPVFGLAKENEWLFEPGRSEPIILDRGSAALKLLQQIRDEAHRFAITFHRQLRTRRNLRSLLDDVAGIGPKRKRALLQRYGDIRAIREAELEDLAALPGMTHKAAEEIKQYLNQMEGGG